MKIIDFEDGIKDGAGIMQIIRFIAVNYDLISRFNEDREEPWRRSKENPLCS